MDQQYVAKLAVIQIILKEEFGLDTEKSFSSSKNIAALEKIYDKLIDNRAWIKKQANRRFPQSVLVYRLKREKNFKQKPQQKRLLELLKSGKPVSAIKLQHIIGKRGVLKPNSLGVLLNALLETLRRDDKYFSYSIEPKTINSQKHFRLIIKDTAKFPYMVIQK